MAATRGDIERWLRQAKREGDTHVIVVCDPMDYDAFPVSVRPGEDPRKRVAEINASGNRVMEVYALHLGIERQLNEHRAFHYEGP